MSGLQYDGQYTDEETGFQYLRARYYDPETGQFLSVDPIVALTRSPHGFAANDPTALEDSTGLSWYNPFSWSSHTRKVIGETAGVVGAVAGGVALCAATACVGDAAIAAIGGAGTVAVIGGTAETIGLGAGVVGGVTDASSIYNDCLHNSSRTDSGSCGYDVAVGSIDAVTLGIGGFGGRFVAGETRTIVRSAISIGGGGLSLLVNSRFWLDCA